MHTIRKILTFIYNFIFVDQDKKQISHTKAFSVLGLAMLCVLFPYVVVHGDKAGFDIWIIFAGSVIGFRSARKVLEGRSLKEKE